MPRRGCQLGVRDPQSLLLLPLLARAHRHSAILRTISVDTSDVFAYESRLAPRPARIELSTGRRTPWKELRPANPAGVEFLGSILMTADARNLRLWLSPPPAH